jgi:hypothetical protein
MPDPDSRRRRPSAPPPSKRSSGGGTGGGGPLPFAAVAIGVIIAGLGIGALGSALMNRNTTPTFPTSAPVVTPVPQPSPVTPAPTLAPTASPEPTPSPTAAPARTPKPRPVPTAAVSAAIVASPSPQSASAAPAVSPSASPTTHPAPVVPKPIATVVPAAAPTLAPTTHPAPAATVAAAASAPPARPVAGSADTALSVVRRYLDSLIAGDEAGAYNALGGTAGDRNLDLKEEAFLDKDAHITSMRASHSDATGATVDAEITTARGSYVATFRVANGIIAQHDYIKI